MNQKPHPTLSERLQSIRERLEKATPGPWQAELTPNGPCGQMCYADAVLIPIRTPKTTGPGYTREPYPAIHCDQRAVGPTEWRANMRFIAHARTDIERLIKVVEIQARAISAEIGALYAQGIEPYKLEQALKDAEKVWL